MGVLSLAGWGLRVVLNAVASIDTSTPILNCLCLHWNRHLAFVMALDDSLDPGRARRRADETAAPVWFSLRLVFARPMKLSPLRPLCVVHPIFSIASIRALEGNGLSRKATQPVSSAAWRVASSSAPVMNMTGIKTPERVNRRFNSIPTCHSD